MNKESKTCKTCGKKLRERNDHIYELGYCYIHYCDYLESERKKGIYYCEKCYNQFHKEDVTKLIIGHPKDINFKILSLCKDCLIKVKEEEKQKH
jgi:hypothetical protein